MQTFKQKFIPLFITQFLGAFNDNLMKSALLIFTAFNFPEQSGIYSNVIAGLFILPFFLFSALAGEITASVNRKKLVIFLKTTELLLMILTLIIFKMQNLHLLILLLVLMGTQSTFFGPVKYALLPQLLNKDELVKGNAYIEGGTYLSIILGSVLGASIPFFISCIILITMSLFGLLSSLQINNAPAPTTREKISLNFLKDTYHTLKLFYKNKIIYRTIWGITWFWMIGAFCLTEIFPLASTILNVTPKTVSFFLLLFSLGVAFGAYLSSKILKNKIDLFYVPLSSIGLTLSGFFIFVLTISYEKSLFPATLSEFATSIKGFMIMLSFFTMATFGGIYVVPLNTLLQKITPPQKLSKIIAANNLINALGMVVITLISALLLALNMSIPMLFLSLSIFNLFVIFYISKLYPKELIKSLFRILLKLLYRVKLEGFDNINKAQNKVLIVANHTSLLDGILIASFIPKDICFAINTEWTKHPFVQLFKRIIDFYPIDTENPLSVRNLIAELKQNKTIMMFPEGRISVTGNLMKVYDGAGLVAYTSQADILPLRIEGANLSKLSYIGDKVKTKWFPKITLKMLAPTRITINPQANKSKREQIANELFYIMQQMMTKTESFTGNLYTQLKKSAHTYGNKKIIEDASRHALTYQQFIKLINNKIKEFKHHTPNTYIQEPSIDSAATLFALWALNTPVIINKKRVTQAELFQKTIDIYYRRATNARDSFFTEVPLNKEEGIIFGLLLPILTGAKCFLNNGHKGCGDLVYDTDSTILCLDKTESLKKLGKSASRLDFYALRKVWLFSKDKATLKDKEQWLQQFGIRIKNMTLSPKTTN